MQAQRLYRGHNGQEGRWKGWRRLRKHSSSPLSIPLYHVLEYSTMQHLSLHGRQLTRIRASTPTTAIPAHSRTSAPTPLTLACCTMAAATAASHPRSDIARAEASSLKQTSWVLIWRVLFLTARDFDAQWSPTRGFRAGRNVSVELLAELKLACTIEFVPRCAEYSTSS